MVAPEHLAHVLCGVFEKDVATTGVLQWIGTSQPQSLAWPSLAAGGRGQGAEDTHVVEEGGDVEDLAVDHNPDRFGRVVLLDFGCVKDLGHAADEAAGGRVPGRGGEGWWEWWWHDPPRTGGGRY